MNTTDVITVCATLLAAGLILALRRLARMLSWERYSFRATVEFKPAPPKTAANGSAGPRAPENRAERPAIAPVPQGGDMTLHQAAQALGVGYSTLRANEQAWGIERSGRTGPRGVVFVTAESVQRHLNGSGS